MEYMESQMQNQTECGLQSEAFRDGLMEGARILREAAEKNDSDAYTETNIAKAYGLNLAAAVLRSWSNALEIRAFGGD